MRLGKKYKLLVASCLLLVAQVVFAAGPFGSPTTSSGGTVSSGGTTKSGGTVTTGTSTQSGGTTQAGGTTQSGGTAQSGGTLQNTGGSTQAGGNSRSGGNVGTGGAIQTQRYIPTRYGIFSGGSISSGGTPNNIEGSINNSGGFINSVNNAGNFNIQTQSIFQTPKDFKGFVALIIGIIQILIPIVGALSLWIFFWGLARFIRNSGNETAESEGKELMIWGILALFVMVSVYGILNILYGSIFGGGITGLPLLPEPTALPR